MLNYLKNNFVKQKGIFEMTNNNKRTLGDVMLDIRKNKKGWNVSLKEAAKKLNITPYQLNKLEQGAYLPNESLCRLIEKVYGIKNDRFMEFYENSKEKGVEVKKTANSSAVKSTTQATKTELTNNEPIGKKLGKHFFLLRKKADMSKVELAETSGVSATTIGRLETGNWISRESFEKIALACGQDLNELRNKFDLDKIIYNPIKESLPYTKLGHYLKAARGNQNKKILAEQIGVSLASISAWETGRYRPRPSLLSKVSVAYNLDLTDLKKIWHLYEESRVKKSIATTATAQDNTVIAPPTPSIDLPVDLPVTTTPRVFNERIDSPARTAPQVFDERIYELVTICCSFPKRLQPPDKDLVEKIYKELIK